MYYKTLKISHISLIHYCKLVSRSALFLSAFFFYIMIWHENANALFDFFPNLDNTDILLTLIWLIFMTEMILRFFPSNLESMGCQKQFAKNFHPIQKAKEKTKVKLDCWKSTLAVAIAWFLLNIAIGKLYFIHVIDKGILLLISLAYSICDMICILFFCPFQTWFMKNRCCVTCRIYNWDFAMMFTPFVFIPSFYTWSLLVVSLLLLVYWEIMVIKHPERFMPSCNASLSCKNCKEKLCVHKKQLKDVWKKVSKHNN